MAKNYKLVVIEGVDSSGKETQTRMLFDKLSSCPERVEKIVSYVKDRYLPFG